MQAVTHGCVTKISIVDDQPILREGLAALIEAETDMMVVGQHESVRDTIERLGIDRPDLLLLDLVMPGPSAFSLIQHVKTFHPAMKVVCLTGFPSDVQCQRAFKIGADGFISKCVPSQQLYQFLRKVLAGKRVVYTPESIDVPAESVATEADNAEDLPEDFRLLTKREIEVLQLIASGKTAKAIAKDLFISKRTVDRHKTNIMAKLQVTSQLQLALRFHGLSKIHPI